MRPLLALDDAGKLTTTTTAHGSSVIVAALRMNAGAVGGHALATIALCAFGELWRIGASPRTPIIYDRARGNDVASTDRA
jgi:hypothetical protein